MKIQTILKHIRTSDNSLSIVISSENKPGKNISPGLIIRMLISGFLIGSLFSVISVSIKTVNLLEFNYEYRSLIGYSVVHSV